MSHIPFSSPKSPIFVTKLPKCRKYGITIIYRGTQKNSGRTSGKCKKYFYQYSSHFANPKTQISSNFIHHCRYFLQHYYRGCPHSTQQIATNSLYYQFLSPPVVSYFAKVTCHIGASENKMLRNICINHPFFVPLPHNSINQQRNNR